MLTFIIPVRHPKSVADWSLVRLNMAETARSICAQANPAWEAYLVANREADLPALPDGIQVVRVDFDFEPLPDMTRDIEAYYEAVRLDKGRRILAGLLAAKPSGHVMISDYDDLVSRRLAGLCDAQPTVPGWYFDRGYLYSGGRLLADYPAEFHEFCGTSHIIRADLLALPNTAEEADVGYIKRTLGSHKFIKLDLERAGEPLQQLPFPGAVYRIGHSGATSRSRPLRSHIVNRSAFRRPLKLLKDLARFQYINRSMRDEFFGGHL